MSRELFLPEQSIQQWCLKVKYFTSWQMITEINQQTYQTPTDIECAVGE